VAVVERKLVHGTPDDLAAALAKSPSSSTINTSFVERQNGTDRSYNARKARKSYEFSKDLLVHVAVTWWVMFCYNFHHLHRSLRLKGTDGVYVQRTPAMAIGIEQRPLSISEILTTQVVGFALPRTPTLRDFRGNSGRARAP
jgi:hypothetical protein